MCGCHGYHGAVPASVLAAQAASAARAGRQLHHCPGAERISPNRDRVRVHTSVRTCVCVCVLKNALVHCYLIPSRIGQGEKKERKKELLIRDIAHLTKGFCQE